jgi:Fe-S-cluster containining protein
MADEEWVELVVPACAGCGRCCHLTVELGAGDDVPESLVAYFEGARLMDQHGNGACVALDPATRLCTIYDRRPAVCRAFGRGSDLCRAVLRSRLGARNPAADHASYTV